MGYMTLFNSPARQPTAKRCPYRSGYFEWCSYARIGALCACVLVTWAAVVVVGAAEQEVPKPERAAETESSAESVAAETEQRVDPDPSPLGSVSTNKSRMI
jgi:hypothetical protein